MHEQNHIHTLTIPYIHTNTQVCVNAFIAQSTSLSRSPHSENTQKNEKLRSYTPRQRHMCTYQRHRMYVPSQRALLRMLKHVIVSTHTHIHRLGVHLTACSAAMLTSSQCISVFTHTYIHIIWPPQTKLNSKVDIIVDAASSLKPGPPGYPGDQGKKGPPGAT